MVFALMLALVLVASDVVPLRIVHAPSGGGREDPPVVTRKTDHYDLRVDTSEEQADELAAVLEACWPVFRDYFKCEPRLGKSDRLDFELYPSREAWVRGILGDKIGQPAQADCSWFSNKTKKVYVYRSGIDYVTRAHSIYGACLQFHALAKSKNIDLNRDWYIHGIGEMFSSHTWYEKKLELAVVRRVSTIDLAADAWGPVRNTPHPWKEERLALPGVRCAAIRFAREKYPSRLEKLALGTTGSKMSGADFLKSMGPEAQVEKEFVEWLSSAQIPFDVLSWSFEELSDGRIVGRPATNEIASCRLKNPVRAFEAVIPLGGGEKGSGALLLTWKPPFEIEVARFTEPMAFIEKYTDGKLAESIEIPMPKTKDGRVRARLVRDGEIVLIYADDAVLHEMPIEEPLFGLAALGHEVVFEKVSWE